MSTRNKASRASRSKLVSQKCSWLNSTGQRVLEPEPVRLRASDYRNIIVISFSGRAHNHHPGDIRHQINHILVGVSYITYPTYCYYVMNLLVHSFSSLQLIHSFSGDWNQSSTHVGRREIFLKHRSWPKVQPNDVYCKRNFAQKQETAHQ